jgi:hypothetical protein
MKKLCVGCKKNIFDVVISHKMYCDTCIENGVKMTCEECNEEYYKSSNLHGRKERRLPAKRTRNLCGKCVEKFKNISDETGNTFGCLTVLKFDGSRKGKAYWLCECDCDDIRLYKGSELRKLGDTRVCTHGENKWNTIRSYYNKVTV